MLCMMCEKGMDETVEYLMLECERYGYARIKMLRIVAEETGVQEWSEMRENKECYDSRLMEYLMG